MLILSSLLIVFPVKVAFNCVEYIPVKNILVNHFFRDILFFDELTFFYYDPENYVYSYEEKQTTLSEADLINIQEWKNKLDDKSITDKDIASFLYFLAPPTYWKNKEAWDLNNRLLSVAREKSPEVYSYLQLLKEVEFKIGGGTRQTWEYNENILDKDLHLVEKLETLFNSTKDSFLKRRYAYKLISVYYYIYLAEVQHSMPVLADKKLKMLFQTAFETGPKDWLYYSAKHYYALLMGNDFILETYMHGKDKRERAADLLSKSYLERKFIQSTNLEEKATCLVVQLFRNPGPCLKDLKTIYKLQPTNKDFKFLVTREINKLENWLWSKKISGLNFNDEFWYDRDQPHFYTNYKKDLAYAHEVSLFLKLVISQETTRSEDHLFYSLAIAYIDLLTGNLSSANRILIKEDTYNKNPRLALQAKVISFLIEMQTKPIDHVFEQHFLQLINEIKNYNRKEISDYYADQLTRTVAEYLKKNPAYRAKGFLLNTQHHLIRSKEYYYLAEMYEEADENDIDAILNVIRKTHKTDFEKFISKNVCVDEYSHYNEPIDTLTLLDYKGLKLIRKNKLLEAYQVYTQLSDSILNTEPFSYIRDDVFMFRYRHAGEFIYNKKTFLAQLIKYKQQLMLNPNDALINFYVGNAYLNMTIHGNAWPMLSNYVSSYTENSEYVNLINHHFVYADWALPYYKKALKNVTDPKLKVLIQINLAYITHIPKNEDKAVQLNTLKLLCKNTNEYELLTNAYSNCDIYYDYTQLFARKGNKIAKQQVWNKTIYN